MSSHCFSFIRPSIWAGVTLGHTHCRFFAEQAILDKIQRAVGEKRQAERAAGVKVAYTSRR